MFFLEVPIPDDLYEAAKLDRDLIEQITLRDEGEGSQLISRTYEVRYVMCSCVLFSVRTSFFTESYVHAFMT